MFPLSYSLFLLTTSPPLPLHRLLRVHHIASHPITTYHTAQHQTAPHSTAQHSTASSFFLHPTLRPNIYHVSHLGFTSFPLGNFLHVSTP
mmetsp:Transcript_23553/g.39471  ORF Transcript_23553/g.39471 Transcript_23553/m.39471 type:complete len:90 (-) Transcript_23553:101-370(-)